MAESTFLTSLKMDTKAQSKAQKREELLVPMKSGDQILKLHSELQALADDLDEKVEGKLNNNEWAFFLAYKSHMYTVQKEFNELRQKADEEETKTRRDAKISSLEKELDWFMNEALRLDELCKKYKKELDKWKGKADALEDDRQFLQNQIMTAKKNNKNLRTAVEKAQTSAYSALVASDDASKSRTALPAQEAPAAPAPEAATEGKTLALTNSGLSRELEERYQMCVKRLKQQLETEQRLAAKMRSVSDRQFGEPSELEAFFLQCIEQVKRDIKVRKKDAVDYSRRLIQGNSQKAQTKEPPPVKGKGGKYGNPNAPVSIDDFTVVDRRKVVELLLSSDRVLQFLYDKLFPPNTGGLAIQD
jgi:hypothetical protein